MHNVLSFFFVSLFFTSCNGQIKTEKPKEIIVEQPSVAGKNTKLIKTLGSNEYQGISCGLEDKKGNIWFGTGTEGVFLYEDKVFTQFTIKDGLSSNVVRAILEDRDGNIWFGTNKGVCYYDGKTIQQIRKSITAGAQLSNTISAKSPFVNDVYSIMQDKKGIIWFGTKDGVVCYDGNNYTRFLDDYSIKNDSSLTLKYVQCIFEDKNGNLWFGSGPMAFDGIGSFDGKTLTKFKPQGEGWVRKIAEEKSGNILFDTRHFGMITYDGKTFSDYVQPHYLRKELLQAILVDSKGNIWYGSDYTNDNDITKGGLWKYDGKSFTEFTKKDGLSNTSVTLILEDKKGNIWVGSRNCELYRYNGQTFEIFSE